jgi:hypothetical protein
MRFNDERYQKMYENIKRDAMKEGYSEEDLEKPYLDKLSKQTKSVRIMKMIRLAYWLGWLRGIKFCDEMLNAKITLR